MNEPLVRSVRDAARVTGYPRDALYEAIHSGRLPHIRRGRRLLVVMPRLVEFIEKEVIATTQPDGKNARQVL